MDNTLIDDRRIHVDFSQSVSKLWSQYRQGKRSQNKGNILIIQCIRKMNVLAFSNQIKYLIYCLD